jgi:dTDP-4-amino-4,6-dideoxygalactose transaminase
MTSSEGPESASVRLSPSDQLAVHGGVPVRDPLRSWPGWPTSTRQTRLNLDAVLDSGRWAITSPPGRPLFERKFAGMFAAYNGVRHCVPVDHGSSALVIALESLRLDYGDTVLVPALTWVASASAVLRAGLVPVLVDVDSATGCIDPAGLDLSVNPKAVIAVHWSCAMADVPALQKACAPFGITVLEDAAQAHGAEWLGHRAGSLGRLGCFSMQHSKTLTGGEGGAVITSDDTLAPVLEELRADSRRYADPRTAPQGLELEESATIMGANFCMSEFSAAVLCAQLDLLDVQHDTRNQNYALLARLIEGLEDVRLLRQRPEQTRLSVYEAVLVFDPLPPRMTNADVAEALSAELHTRFYPPREPLARSHLLKPWTKPTLAPLSGRFVSVHQDRVYPNAEYMSGHAVLTPHSTFLGDEADMRDIADAIAKVVRYLP